MINFIFSVISIWIFMAVALLSLYALDTYLLTPVCAFFSDNPIILYIAAWFLVTVLIYSGIIVYYRIRPNKKLPGWLQRACDKNPDVRKLLNR